MFCVVHISSIPIEAGRFERYDGHDAMPTISIQRVFYCLGEHFLLSPLICNLLFGLVHIREIDLEPESVKWFDGPVSAAIVWWYHAQLRATDSSRPLFVNMYFLVRSVTRKTSPAEEKREAQGTMCRFQCRMFPDRGHSGLLLMTSKLFPFIRNFSFAWQRFVLF